MTDPKPPKPEAMRTCVLTGAELPQSALLRFACAPDGVVVPDLSRKLPGHGAWLTFTRDAVEQVAKAPKNPFARAFKRPCRLPDGLPEMLETQLYERFYASLALARRSGALIFGFEKTRKLLQSGQSGVYLTAADADTNARIELSRLAGNLPIVANLDAARLGQVCGEDAITHAALTAAGAEPALTAYARWQAFCGNLTPAQNG